MANQNSTQTATNLGVTTLNILETSIYNLNVTLELQNNVPTPTAGSGGGAGTGTVSGTQIASQVVTTVRKNGSIILTSDTGARGITLVGIDCTAGDTLTVTTTSSLSQDQQKNAVKATIALSEGPL